MCRVEVGRTKVIPNDMNPTWSNVRFILRTPLIDGTITMLSYLFLPVMIILIEFEIVRMVLFATLLLLRLCQNYTLYHH